MYEHRFYRDWMDRKNLSRFHISLKESDLLILCDHPDTEQITRATLKDVRKEIEQYILEHKIFKESLEPIEIQPGTNATSIIVTMIEASKSWNVGPMASVAGAVAQFVGERLAKDGFEVIVENGGDIFAKVKGPVIFGLYAGEDSPFRDKVAFSVDATDGIGVCTSSGKVGPSLSFGLADAVVAVAKDAAYADAAATCLGNQIKQEEDVQRVIEEQKIKGDLAGVIACMGNRMGIFGDIELVKKIKG